MCWSLELFLYFNSDTRTEQLPSKMIATGNSPTQNSYVRDGNSAVISSRIRKIETQNTDSAI